eukprot:7189030-Pyramimonas_sp.AAC.1
MGRGRCWALPCASSGFVDGCSMATALIRAFIVVSIGRAQPPRDVRPCVHIGDCDISATECESLVYEGVVEGSYITRDVTLSGLHAQLAARVRAELGGLAGGA